LNIHGSNSDAPNSYREFGKDLTNKSKDKDYIKNKYSVNNEHKDHKESKESKELLQDKVH
jgi:hypothetical protein